MHAPDAACAALGRDVTVKSKRRSTDCEGQCKNNYGALDSLVQRSGDQRSGLNLSFAWSLRPVPQGALRQARILNRSCTKTRAFIYSPGVTQKNPRALPIGYCTRAIGAPVATAINRSNPEATRS